MSVYILNSKLISALITLLLCIESNGLLAPINNWISIAKSNVKKSVSIATAIICVTGCGPAYSYAADTLPTLQDQLKLIQG